MDENFFLELDKLLFLSYFTDGLNKEDLVFLNRGFEKDSNRLFYYLYQAKTVKVSGFFNEENVPEDFVKALNLEFKKIKMERKENPDLNFNNIEGLDDVKTTDNGWKIEVDDNLENEIMHFMSKNLNITVSEEEVILPKVIKNLKEFKFM